MVLLEISKADLISKLPKESLATLEVHALERKKWLRERCKNISKTVKTLYNQDHQQAVYD